MILKKRKRIHDEVFLEAGILSILSQIYILYVYVTNQDISVRQVVKAKGL